MQRYFIIKSNIKNKIKKLEQKKYNHNLAATYRTGGDNDFLVIDEKRKEYCYWENGFYPFCYESNFPITHNLKYWAEHRS